MNFKALESAQKLRGGYYTHPDIALFLSRWVLQMRPSEVLEPSCGDGAFIQALADTGHATLKHVVGCEIDPGEAIKASRRAIAGRSFQVSVYVGDFLRWSLPRLRAEPQFDGVLGNPPFIRYQYLEAEQQRLSQQISEFLGLRFTRHTNAWVPFVLASVAQLRPGGRLAMVVPTEILHVLYASPLRQYLIEHCSRVLILDPDDIWFDGTLQGVVLLLAEKARDGVTQLAELAVFPLNGRDTLNGKASKYLARSGYVSAEALNGNWMLALLSSRERSLLQAIAWRGTVKSFGHVASAKVGIVTGANKFFLVPDSVVAEYGLRKWAHPMFGRSDHVDGVIFDKARLNENRRKGLPTNFIWFKDTPLSELPEDARSYIRLGEAEHLPGRYKCRIRDPWYNVPSVYATPVAMLKRCHHFPRLVMNKVRAFTTDTAYRVTPKRVAASTLVTSFVNSLTALSAELEGRHYGGGVLELVPSEIGRLLVPMGRHSRRALADLDTAIRSTKDPEAILGSQDARVLRPLGFTRRECEELRAAWGRLRRRRQRS